MRISFRNTVEFIKDIRYIITFFGLTGTFALSDLDNFINTYMLTYNLHIFILMLFSLCIFFIIINKRINRLDKKFDEHMEKAAKDRLKGQVKQLAKDLEKVKCITFEHTIKYIYDLEERRIELKLNSFTEATLKDLISRIKG